MNDLSPAQARELLQFHSGRHEDVDHAKWTGGFLGSLRPYRGLDPRNFHEVMRCLMALAPELAAPGPIDRGLVADVWGICHLARAWGVEPGGMLRSEGLIQPEEAERLASWIHQISHAMFCLLDGCDTGVAFEGYAGA